MPQSKSWFSIEAVENKAAKNGKGGRIKIHDEIGGWGVNAQRFLEELEKLGDVTAIDLSIDSPGGSVLDGWSIYNALEQHPAEITATVIGTAASMASVVILAADTILIPENAWVMVHRVRAGASGTHEELKRMSEMAQQMEDQIVGAYVKRTKQPEKIIRDMMNTIVGTWMNGTNAVAKGFADRVLPGTKATAFNGAWRAHFDFLPVALIDTAVQPPPTLHTIDDMKPEEITALINKGITEGLAKALTDALPKALTAEAIAGAVKIDVAAALKTEMDTALKPITDKVEAFGSQIKGLTERTEKAENLIKSGVAGAAGGGRAVAGAAGGEGDETLPPPAPANRVELEKRLGETKDINERRKLLNQFRKTQAANA